jgi:redox-sensitive bicupin YhaK (pirin superfamily)
MTTPRDVTRLIQAHRQLEGAGFVVRRPVPGPGLEQLDPFLLLDEMGPIDLGPGEAVGAPDHPHRGFETVTYIIEGEAQHEDSAGHKGVISTGDVQWMTAGGGVVHSEEPSDAMKQRGGRMHGFQLWVNLPKKDKMMAPRYQEVKAARIPKATSADGLATVTVIAGEALGAKAVIETRTPILYQDWSLKAGARVEAAVPAAMEGFVYVFEGALKVGDREVRDGQLAVLGKGDAVVLAATAPARALLVAGAPLREPMARYGPFVMNTWPEIEQAMADFQAGKMGQISR